MILRPVMQRLDNLCLFRFCNAGIEGEPNQAIADLLGYGTGTWNTAELTAHLRKMKGQIVEDTQYATSFKVRD